MLVNKFNTAWAGLSLKTLHNIDNLIRRELNSAHGVLDAPIIAKIIKKLKVAVD